MKGYAFLIAVAIALLSAAATGAARGGTSAYECWVAPVSETSPIPTCTLNGSGADMDTSLGGYAKVYNNTAAVTNRPKLAAMSYSFNYRCGDGTSTGCIVATPNPSPMLQIGINISGTSGISTFVELTAAACGAKGVVSTTDPACVVRYNDPLTHATVTYANWAALAAAHPTFTVAQQGPDVAVNFGTETVSVTNLVGARVR